MLLLSSSSSSSSSSSLLLLLCLPLVASWVKLLLVGCVFFVVGWLVEQKNEGRNPTAIRSRRPCVDSARSGQDGLLRAGTWRHGDNSSRAPSSRGTPRVCVCLAILQPSFRASRRNGAAWNRANTTVSPSTSSRQFKCTHSEEGFTLQYNGYEKQKPYSPLLQSKPKSNIESHLPRCASVWP